MNQTALRRLLSIFPVSDIRAQWEAKGRTKDDAIGEVLSKASEPDIVQFSQTKMGLTKQHIYLFEHDSYLSDLGDTVLADREAHSVKTETTESEFFYLVPLTFPSGARRPFLQFTATGRKPDFSEPEKDETQNRLRILLRGQT